VILALEILLLVLNFLVIVLVLLHKGKGGGLSDLFGGGVSSSLGGSSVAERNLDRITVGLLLVWAATIVALGLAL
jgi:preprotein translocase subunit SecG